MVRENEADLTLPFSAVYNLIKSKKNSLEQVKHILRSISQENELLDQMQVLAEKCYNFLFSAEDLDISSDVVKGLFIPGYVMN